MAIAPLDAAYLINETVGVPYTGLYTVIYKYTSYGNHPHHGVCHGIAVANDTDPSDVFRMCVSQAEQDETIVGDKMKVKGRRSRYVDQMLGYERLS